MAISHIMMMSLRSLRKLIYGPEGLISNLAISAFFLVVFAATLGDVTGALASNPLFSGQFDFLLEEAGYIAFLLPFTLVSGALSSPAGQAVVLDIENGYFDKLLLTPISRSALVLGPIISSGVGVMAVSLIIVIIGFAMGLHSETGVLGILVLLLIAMVLGIGFGGFSVAVALFTNSPTATQAASFLFFPLTFLTSAFVPAELLADWLGSVAALNPITWILDAMRAILIEGWAWDKMWLGLLGCFLLGAIPFGAAMLALRRRVRRR